MKHRELKTLPKNELEQKLTDLKKELMKERTSLSTGTTPKSPGTIRIMKKTIARITALLERD